MIMKAKYNVRNNDEMKIIIMKNEIMKIIIIWENNKCEMK